MQKRFLFLSLFYFSSILLFGQKQGNKIKDYGLKNYSYVSEKLPHSESKTWYLTCKMPYNCQFQQWIEIESTQPDSITFSSTNPLVLYLTPKEKIKTVSSQNIYEAKNWISGEGAIYKIPAFVIEKPAMTQKYQGLFSLTTRTLMCSGKKAQEQHTYV